MQAVTLTSVCPYDGTTNILGVFNNVDAVLERLRIHSTHVHVGTEYRIEVFEIKTYAEQKRDTTECLKSRAEYKKQQEKLKKLEETLTDDE